MRRWLTRLGLLLAIVVLGGGTFLAWPFVWPANPDATLRTVAGRQVGEATGYVVSLDAEAGVLTISSSIFGLRPVALAIDADTPITIRDKQGGLGDLAVDMPVRVAYEIEGETRHARSVELVVPDSESRVRVPTDILTPPASASSPPTPTVDLPSRAEPARPAVPAAAVDVAPKQPALVPAAMRPAPTRTIVERTHAATPPPAATPASARPPIEDEKAIEAAAARAAAAPSRARPVDDGGPADGSGAIDWLLHSRDR